jgi:hypothetical protein
MDYWGGDGSRQRRADESPIIEACNLHPFKINSQWQPSSSNLHFLRIPWQRPDIRRIRTSRDQRRQLRAAIRVADRSPKRVALRSLRPQPSVVTPIRIPLEWQSRSGAFSRTDFGREARRVHTDKVEAPCGVPHLPGIAEGGGVRGKR